jgi:hypothetical protein
MLLGRARPRATAIAALLAAAGALAPSDAARAAVHALVVGINDYVGAPEGPPKLFGAVNDARDVSGALEAAGAASVTMLLDRDATRERVFAAWEALIEASAPGDLLVFHFAGHGINEPDQDGDEPDGQDEAYLFAEYDDGPNVTSRVVDDELDSWLALATDKDRKVLFVADACHSGSPTRSILGKTLPTRNHFPSWIGTEPERPRPAAPEPSSPEALRESVFSVGATLDSFSLPEITIGDAFRGALSYAVARAFEGGADLDGDGRILAGEFELFVEENVRSLAKSKQTPQFDMPDETFPILGRVIDVVPDGPDPSSTQLHVRPGADAAFEAALAEMEHVALTQEESAAELVYDPASRQLLNNVRDMVAENLDLQGLKTAIEADQALKDLQTLRFNGTLPIAFSPDDGIHAEGTQIGFSVPDVGGRFLTIFDLTTTGTVHFLWPLGPEDVDPWSERTFSLDAVVTPPFGADNLVVLATDAPPEAFRAELRRIDGKREPAALIERLEAAVGGQAYRIAIQAFFTRAK